MKNTDSKIIIESIENIVTAANHFVNDANRVLSEYKTSLKELNYIAFSNIAYVQNYGLIFKAYKTAIAKINEGKQNIHKIKSDWLAIIKKLEKGVKVVESDPVKSYLLEQFKTTKKQLKSLNV